MPEDTNAIWQKLSEHEKSIQSLDVQQQLNQKILEQHAEEFRTMNRSASQQHGETMARMEDLAADVRLVINDFHERQGASRVVKIYLPILIGVIGLALTYLAFFQ